MKWVKVISVITLCITMIVMIQLSTTQSQSGYTVREIMNRVWDRANHRLLSTPNLTAQSITATEVEIWNDVFDPVNNKVKMSGSVQVYETSESLPAPCVAGDVAVVSTTLTSTLCNTSGDGWDTVSGNGTTSTQPVTTGIITDATSIRSVNKAVTTLSTNGELDQVSVVMLLPPSTGLTVSLKSAALSVGGEYTAMIDNDTNGIVTLLANGSDTLNNGVSPIPIQGRGSRLDILRTSSTNWDVEIRTGTPTGTVNFSSATGLNVPVQVSPTPTIAGDIRYDSTKKRFVVGTNGMTLALVGNFGILSGGDINNSSSGSGSDYIHSLSFTIPTLQLYTNTLIEACVMYRLVTGTSAPALIPKFKIAGTTFATVNAITIGNNIASRTAVLCYNTLVLADPGAAVNTFTGIQVDPENISDANSASTSTQPITAATNGTLALTFTTQWGSVGTGVNTAEQLGAWIRINK